MDALILTHPDETMLDEISAYRKAMLDAESSMDGTSGLQDYPSAAEWLRHVRSLEKPETCPAHLVTATLYVCQRITDGCIVGMIDLRHRLNEYLAEYGGHIGYSTRPDERRKGYAKWMLAHVLSEARRLGLPRVLVTCDDDNEGSRRTIEANGGVFERTATLEDEVLRRYWIEL